MIITLLKDFFHFLIKPNDNKLDFGEYALLKKVSFMLFLFPIIWILSMGFLFTVLFILNQLGFEMPEINGVGGKAIAEKQLSLPMMFIAGAIVAPILEEVQFRLPLKFNQVFIPTAIALYYFSHHVLTLNFYSGNFDFQSIATETGIAIVLFIGTHLFLKIGKIKTLIKRVYKKHFGILFYIITITFGILHYNGSELSIYILGVTMPQIIMGIFLGYFRLKLGFFYGLMLHIIWNAMGILI